MAKPASPRPHIRQAPTPAPATKPAAASAAPNKATPAAKAIAPTPMPIVRMRNWVSAVRPGLSVLTVMTKSSVGTLGLAAAERVKGAAKASKSKPVVRIVVINNFFFIGFSPVSQGWLVIIF
jgi:hypothetical protein